MTAAAPTPEDLRRSLRTYVIYDSPRDFPGLFVLRVWYTLADGRLFVNRDPTALRPTLEAVRRFLPRGVVRLGRQGGDDPAISEVWI